MHAPHVTPCPLPWKSLYYLSYLDETFTWYAVVFSHFFTPGDTSKMAFLLSSSVATIMVFFIHKTVAFLPLHQHVNDGCLAEGKTVIVRRIDALCVTAVCLDGRLHQFKSQRCKNDGALWQIKKALPTSKPRSVDSLARILRTSTRFMTITSTTPMTTARLCRPGDIVGSGRSGNWCYVTMCAADGMHHIHGDDFNCSTPPRTTTPTTTTPTTTTHLCRPGEIISTGQSGKWCYVTMCSDDGMSHIHGDDFNCNTTPPTTIPRGHLRSQHAG